MSVETKFLKVFGEQHVGSENPCVVLAYTNEGTPDEHAGVPNRGMIERDVEALLSVYRKAGIELAVGESQLPIEPCISTHGDPVTAKRTENSGLEVSGTREPEFTVTDVTICIRPNNFAQALETARQFLSDRHGGPAA